MMRHITFALLLSIALLVLVIGLSVPGVAQKATQVVVTNTSANPVPVVASGNSPLPVAVQGTPNVNIKSANPVPVVASGNAPLPVAVQGTPSVNINSMPAVALGAGATVAVDPASTVNIADASPRNIVRLHASGTMTGDTFFTATTTGINPVVFFVPAGKRLIINSIAGEIVLPGGTTPFTLIALNTGNGSQTFTYLEPRKTTFNLAGLDWYIVNFATPLYADTGTQISLFVRENPASGGDVDFYFQGYLVDCVTGCTQQ